MIKFKSEIEEYENCIRKNIQKFVKASKEEDWLTINSLLKDIFGSTCINNAPIYRFDCDNLYCSECKKIFARELIIKYGKKNNIKW